MPYARFIAERQDDVIYLEKVSADLPIAEGGVMRMVITGAASAGELASIAARSHFDMHPDRKRAFIIALSTSGPE